MTETRCGAYPAEALAKKLEAIQSKMQAITLPPEATKTFASLSTLEPRQIDDTKSPFQSFYADKNSPWYVLGIEYQNLRFGPIETRRQFLGKARPDGLTIFLKAGGLYSSFIEIFSHSAMAPSTSTTKATTESAPPSANKAASSSTPSSTPTDSTQSAPSPTCPRSSCSSVRLAFPAAAVLK